MSDAAPRSRPPRSADLRSIAFAIGGAALLVVVAARYRLDRTLCEAWPPYATGALYGALYGIAIAALAHAWRRGHLTLAAILLVHLVAIFAAPFLSSDPLMYAAVGRALSLGAPADRDISSTLGAGHAFLVPLVPAWRHGTGAYGPVWNAIASLIGHVTKDDLNAALRAHQLVAMLALLGGAAIVARTRAHFALVVLCPLAIVEATIGAHNDALLVPFVALALVLRRKPWASLLVLLLATTVKASALVYAAPVAGALVLSLLPTPRARRLALVSVLPLCALALVVMSRLGNGPLDALARIVGQPDVPFDHCTRSFECLPRILFRFVLHMPFAAWVTGIVFRVLGAAWLAYAGLRAAECGEEQRVGWIVRGLFVYFLALHGWAQSWYALPLVAALPFLEDDRRTGPAFRVYLVTAVAYYALVLPMSCLQNPVATAASDLAEGLITVTLPIWLLCKTTRAS